MRQCGCRDRGRRRAACGDSPKKRPSLHACIFSFIVAVILCWCDTLLMEPASHQRFPTRCPPTNIGLPETVGYPSSASNCFRATDSLAARKTGGLGNPGSGPPGGLRRSMAADRLTFHQRPRCHLCPCSCFGTCDRVSACGCRRDNTSGGSSTTFIKGLPTAAWQPLHAWMVLSRAFLKAWPF